MPQRFRFRVIVTALLVIVGSIFAAAPANAASSTPGDFSSFVSPNPRVFAVDDCTAEVGIVVSQVAFPNYRRVGGVRVNCRSVHSVIDATVALYYYNGSRWVQWGASTYGVRYRQAGSGYGIGGILRTSEFCVGAYKRYYWMVGATVRTERTGYTNYSYSHYDANGC